MSYFQKNILIMIMLEFLSNKEDEYAERYGPVCRASFKNLFEDYINFVEDLHNYQIFLGRKDDVEQKPIHEQN